MGVVASSQEDTFGEDMWPATKYRCSMIAGCVMDKKGEYKSEKECTSKCNVLPTVLSNLLGYSSAIDMYYASGSSNKMTFLMYLGKLGIANLEINGVRDVIPGQKYDREYTYLFMENTQVVPIDFDLDAKCVVLYDGVHSIRHVVNRHNLSNIYVFIDAGTSITTLGDDFLARCPSLKTLHFLPMASITHVGSRLFEACDSLTNADFSGLENVESIADDWLSLCPKLTSVIFNLPSLRAIGSNCISACHSIKMIEFNTMPLLRDVKDGWLSNSSLVTAIISS